MPHQSLTKASTFVLPSSWEDCWGWWWWETKSGLCFSPQADKERSSRALQLSAVVVQIALKVGAAHICPSCGTVPGLGPQDSGAGSCRDHRRTLVPAAGTSHLLPVTVSTDNNRQLLIPFQLFGAIFKVLHISVEIRSREERAVGARVHGPPPTPPPPCWWSPFPSFNKSAPSHPTHAG